MINYTQYRTQNVMFLCAVLRCHPNLNTFTFGNKPNAFLQRVSIAERCIRYDIFCPSDRLSVTRCTGCLQLLEILEISWNLKTLLEISWNLIGPRGNFCIKCRSHKNMDKYCAKNTKFIAIRCVLSSSGCTKTRFRPWLRPGPLWGSVWRSPDSYLAGEGTPRAEIPIVCIFQLSVAPPKEAEARQTCPGFFLKSLLDSPGNLLEICLVKFVDTLLYHGQNDFSYTNRKTHTRFRLVPKSSTLDDLERAKRTPLQKRCVFWSPLHKFEWR